MTKPPRAGFRLIDGVIVAAVALLALKALGLFAGRPETLAEPQPSSFGRVLSHARTNFDLADPTTTGSTGRKPEEANATAAPAKAASPVPASPAAAPPAMPATERLLLDRLSERREELQQRSRDVDERQKLIEDQEKRLEERLGKLQSIEDARKNAGGSRGDADAAAMKSLVVMYETMKPKEAARVFERLPQDVLVSVVTQMNSRKMSEVLAAMSPETAEKLTVALAKRGRAAVAADERASIAGLPGGELPAIDPPAAAPAR